LRVQQIQGSRDELGFGQIAIVERSQRRKDSVAVELPQPRQIGARQLRPCRRRLRDGVGRSRARNIRVGGGTRHGEDNDRCDDGATNEHDGSPGPSRIGKSRSW
jgi:hypothetical protein